MRQRIIYCYILISLGALLSFSATAQVSLVPDNTSPTPKQPNKLDRLIQKVFLAASATLAGQDDTVYTIHETIPSDEIKIQAAPDQKKSGSSEPKLTLKADDEGLYLDTEGMMNDVNDSIPQMHTETSEKKADTPSPPAEAVPIPADPQQKTPLMDVLVDEDVKTHKGSEPVDNVNPLYWKELARQYRDKKRISELQAKKKKGPLGLADEKELEALLQWQGKPIDGTDPAQWTPPPLDGSGGTILPAPLDNTTPSETTAHKPLVPTKRPNDSYRTVRLPSEINKKQYDAANQHMPIAMYQEDYQKILFDAVALGKLDVIRAMVQRLGTTEIRDKDGNTPLMYAIMSDNDASLKVLLALNASINTSNYNGVTPLDTAEKAGRKDIAAMLIHKGATTAEEEADKVASSDTLAQRSADGIPIPVRRPFRPKDGKAPTPQFSAEERAEMKDGN